MQYILSEKEYTEWLAKAEAVSETARAVLQQLCTQVCDHMPISLNWGPWQKCPTPWGCILSVGNDDWACDHCPVQKVCPYEYKEFSK